MFGKRIFSVCDLFGKTEHAATSTAHVIKGQVRVQNHIGPLSELSIFLKIRLFTRLSQFFPPHSDDMLKEYPPHTKEETTADYVEERMLLLLDNYLGEK